jgi:PAS domain S-box-containing protein
MPDLRILQIEDSESDAAMIIRLLEKAGNSIQSDRVDDAAQMREALARQDWDAVICDYRMPEFDAPEALVVLQQTGLDIPFIVVSGTIGEDIAVEMMRKGAQDYMIKNNLTRLAPSLARAVAEARNRHERKRIERSLQDSEERCRRAIVDSPIPIMLHAEDGEILQISQSWCDITGYTREELLTIGDWTERAYGERKEWVQAEIERLYGLEQRVAEGDYTIRTKSGATRIWEFSSAPQGRLSDGRRLAISMAMDVTERRLSEKTLRDSLDEKTILIKEIHHRVKNNLQIIISLLNLQAAGIRNPEVLDVFQTTRNRVHSMALLHETLYRSKNLARLDIDAFIKQLASHLFHVHGSAAARIRLQCDATGVELNLEQAVPCGLIVNELLSNSLKYAFPEGRTGQITVGIRSGEKGQAILIVADDGVGLPAALDIEQTESLGLKLVSILTQQLKGELQIERQRGTLFRILFQTA